MSVEQVQKLAELGLKLNKLPTGQWKFKVDELAVSQVLEFMNVCPLVIYCLHSSFAFEQLSSSGEVLGYIFTRGITKFFEAYLWMYKGKYSKVYLLKKVDGQVCSLFLADGTWYPASKNVTDSELIDKFIERLKEYQLLNALATLLPNGSSITLEVTPENPVPGLVVLDGNIYWLTLTTPGMTDPLYSHQLLDQYPEFSKYIPPYWVLENVTDGDIENFINTHPELYNTEGVVAYTIVDDCFFRLLKYKTKYWIDRHFDTTKDKNGNLKRVSWAQILKACLDDEVYAWLLDFCDKTGEDLFKRMLVRMREKMPELEAFILQPYRDVSDKTLRSLLSALHSSHPLVKTDADNAFNSISYYMTLNSVDVHLPSPVSYSGPTLLDLAKDGKKLLNHLMK